ncbi:MAG TPA: SPOR domain-containing protein [Magnetospirillaceae bacterium]|nr:SPOR domain-containing protein [Magnetospirillaceae bacterium]
MAAPRDPFGHDNLDEDREILDIIPERFDADPDSRHARRAAHTRLILTVSLAVLAVMALGVAARHILFGEAPKDHQLSVPVIHADDKPIKVKPQDRGGMDVPNQDKLIYDRMAAKNGDQQPERLLPPPEAAQAPPAPEQKESAPPAPAPAPAPSMTAPAPAVTAPLPPKTAQTPAASAPMPAPAPAKPQPLPQPPVQQPAAKPAPAPAPAPAATAKTGGGWVVQLGAVHSEAEAKTEWNRLAGAHHQLAGLSADIVRVDIPGKGVFWRVRGGPLDEAAARVLCSDLTKQGQGCLVARK